MEHEEQQPTTARDAAPAAPAAPRIRAAGAQPSITAPANSIRPLRHGIDSLYVSYAGAIDPKIALALQELKTFAQSTSDQVLAQAIYREGDHRLTVLPHGRGRFAFVLEDNWFQIQVANACASALPLAHVQIRSEYLTAVGAEEALRTLQGLILSLGEPKGLPIISRVDLFVDFIGENDLALQPGVAWVKRCRKRSIHEEANRITGISFGAGNEVSARLYDKTAETAKTGKDFLTPLWTAKGWKPDETVWRMEFQARREALPEVLRGAVADALPHLGAWWRYLATDWLRLAQPSDSDETRSRWPTHPVWEALASVWDVPADAPLMQHVDKARPPSDDAIFKSGLWGLSSFMAREGIADYSEGLGEFLHALERYHEDNPLSEGLAAYLDRKVRLKARRYNTRVRDHEKD